MLSIMDSASRSRSSWDSFIGDISCLPGGSPADLEDYEVLLQTNNMYNKDCYLIRNKCQQSEIYTFGKYSLSYNIIIFNPDDAAF